MPEPAVDAIRVAANTLASGSGNTVTWYPQYGCALLALGCLPGKGDVRPGPDLALHLVCLDDWEYYIHT